MKKFIFGFIFVLGCGCVFSACAGSLADDGKITTYTQQIEFDNQAKTLTASQNVNFYNSTGQTLDSIKLHLYPNAFRQFAKASVVSLANTQKAYPDGKSYGDIIINSINHKGSGVEFKIEGEDENILTISLSEKVVPEAFYNFDINFVVKLANINHRLGYGQNTINVCNYYPIVCYFQNGDWVTDLYNSNGDPFYSKVANYNVEISYDKNLVLASTGVQNIEEKQNNMCAKITAKNVRDFAFVLSDKFKTEVKKHDGIEFKYLYYDDATPEKTMQTITEVFDFNKNFAGEYPYECYTVCEANFVHGGMEYPQIVLISDDLDSYETYINVVIHETCHQWWYGVVGNDEFSYGWIDEGLTDYNTAIFYDAYPKYNQTSKQIIKNADSLYQSFVEVYGSVYENLDTSMNRKLNEFPSEYEYVFCTYTKGMLLFDSLKDFVGDKKFDKCIKYYYKQNMYKEVDPDKLIKDFSYASKKDLSSYIKSWTDGEMVVISNAS